MLALSIETRIAAVNHLIKQAAGSLHDAREHLKDAVKQTESHSLGQAFAAVAASQAELRNAEKHLQDWVYLESGLHEDAYLRHLGAL